MNAFKFDRDEIERIRAIDFKHILPGSERMVNGDATVMKSPHVEALYTYTSGIETKYKTVYHVSEEMIKGRWPHLQYVIDEYHEHEQPKKYLYRSPQWPLIAIFVDVAYSCAPLFYDDEHIIDKDHPRYNKICRSD